MSAADVTHGHGPQRPLSPARHRTVAVALELFARYGVGGTSLQMIADELGVTKAAGYHQFRTKDDVVVAPAQAAHIQPVTPPRRNRPHAKHARHCSPAWSTSPSKAAELSDRSWAIRTSSTSSTITSSS